LIHQFLNRIIIWTALIAAIHLIINLISIWIIFQIIPNNTQTLEIYKQKQKNTHSIAIVGGSNIQSNLEFKEFRDEIDLNIDFYSFPGSTNFNFIQYMIDKKVLDTNKYQKIFLYLPYVCFNSSNSMIHNGFGCFEIFSNGNYLNYLLNKNPSIIFSESWALNLYYQYRANNSGLRAKSKVKFYETTLSSQNPLLLINRNNQNYMHYNTSIPEDKLIINSNPEDINRHHFSTKFYVIHPPIPDISLNKKYIFINNSQNQVLNSYSSKRMNKKYFFDMGGHLNLKGRKIESRKVLNYIKTTIKD